MINVKSIEKSFRVHLKQPGLLGSVKSIFWRQWHEKQALKGVSLEVGNGEILGLLGANGAGKTTLIKVLTGIIHPTGGEVSVLGFNPWERKDQYRRQISLIMGQKAQLWWDLPAADCFLLLKEIYQIPQTEFQRRLDELAETLHVSGLLSTQIRRLSLGERMKMELVAALLHRPRVIFLDEPTIGLDLSSQRALRRFLLDYHKAYRPTIIVTSHYMEDIERLCERIAILREGQIVYDGGLKELVATYATHKYIKVTLEPGEGASLPAFKGIDGIDPQLDGRWGEVLDQDINQITLKVNRSQVPKVSAAVLNRLRVADLNISDMDVGTIVASIQNER